MTQTFNRGEWSELYTVFKLLADGYGGKSASEVVFPPRELGDTDYKSCLYKRNGDYVEGPTGTKMQVSVLRPKLSTFLAELKKGKGTGTINSKTGNELISHFNCTNIKSPSGVKPDLICDGKSYSIKSHIGGSPSIINPANSTIAVFEIIKGNVLDGTRYNLVTAHSLGLEVRYITWAHEADGLKKNFDRICSKGSAIMGNILEQWLNEGKSSGVLSDLALGYEKCVKKIIYAFYVGLKPTKKWDGSSGIDGVLDINRDGEISIFDHSEYVDQHWVYLFLDQDGHMKNRHGSFTPHGSSFASDLRAATPMTINGRRYIVWPLQIREKAPPKRRASRSSLKRFF